MQRPQDLTDHVGGAYFAPTYESRDESPSSNLGRVKQGKSNPRVDDMDPQFKGRSPQRKEREQLGREQLSRSRTTSSKTLHKTSPREVASGDRGDGVGRK